MARAERVLVVVDPTAAVQHCFERAAWLSRRLKWPMQLLICIHGGLPARRLKGADAKAARRVLLGHQLGYLRDLAARFPELDIEVKAVWDRPLHEAIIRETLRYEPHLVMKETHFHSAISRALVTNTDWHLIRDCPAPLWLVRASAWSAHPVLVACVDPLHEHDKPAALDRRILDEGSRLATGLRGELHALHCHDSVPLVAGVGALPTAAVDVENVAAEIQAEHEAALSALAGEFALPPERTHFRSGPPAEVIPAVVRQLKGNLVVMGAVARSRLKHAFIGSTAERLLDELPCDVLVVKPERFHSGVAYRPRPVDFTELH